MTPKARKRQNYILILPSLFTTGNLFCGFFSVIRSFNGDYEKAALAILFAGLFDVLDGRVARMTNSTTKFGVEYDSIADVVSFGMAPAILAYVWALKDFGDVGWASAFFFAACGALRLARFNTMTEVLPKSYFLGLPIPMAANLVASIGLVFHNRDITPYKLIFLILMFALGLMMVSSIRYRSFKDFDVRHKRRFFLLVPIVALLACGASYPQLTLFCLFACYAIWSPIREIVSFVKKVVFKKKPEEGKNEIQLP